MWKATGRATVRQQRSRWVVRVDGVDTETGGHRPRQLGTYASKRSAQRAAAEFAAAGATGGDRGTVGHLVQEWEASRTDVAPTTGQQYEWAAGHITVALGPVRLDRLERGDVARWLESLAREGSLGRRSISILRMVLRAALADAVESGELRRSPAARVALPRVVAKADRARDVDAWDDEALARILAAMEGHRWAEPSAPAAGSSPSTPGPGDSPAAAAKPAASSPTSTSRHSCSTPLLSVERTGWPATPTPSPPATASPTRSRSGKPSSAATPSTTQANTSSTSSAPSPGSDRPITVGPTSRRGRGLPGTLERRPLHPQNTPPPTGPNTETGPTP
jgi:hypothetical protein